MLRKVRQKYSKQRPEQNLYFFRMNRDHLPIFSQNNWLQAALGEEYRLLEFEWEQDIFEVSFQYRRSNGRLWAQTPDFVPWTEFSSRSDSMLPEISESFLNAFRQALPKHTVFHFRFSPDCKVVSEINKDYQLHSRLTHCLPAGSDVLSLMKPTLKRNLKKAERSFEVRNNIDFESLWNLVVEVFKRQGTTPHYGKDRMKRIFEWGGLNDSQRIYVALKDGKEEAVLWILKDEKSSYNFMSGVREEARSLQPGTLLLHRAIQDTMENQRSFDFFGSSIPSIQRYVRSWGAEPLEYWAAEKKPKYFFF